MYEETKRRPSYIVESILNRPESMSDGDTVASSNSSGIADD
jgi:hypothetical protein